MKKNKGKKVLLAIMGVLILGMIAVTICTFEKNIFFADICRLVSLLFVALYGFWLYKVPHGNFLKYAMIFIAVVDIINTAIYLSLGRVFAISLVRLLAAYGIIYCAGRLDKIDQNKVILLIINIVIFINALIGTIIPCINGEIDGVVHFLRSFVGTVMVSTVLIAYITRYKEHKEAGQNQ